jgi:hypothetical protein
MPFGKHRGQPVSSLPISYLLWLWQNVEIKSPELRDAVEAELRSRARIEAYIRRPGERDWLAVIYRRLCMEFHPDRGGSHAAMVAINRFWEAIQLAAEREGQEA